MSLLLTFFVLLLSFATMDEPREFQEALVSIKGAFGVMPHNLTAVQINPSPERMKRPNREVEELARRIQRGLQIQGQDDVRVQFDTSNGLKISLPDAVLYDSGQALLRQDSLPMLENIGMLLGEFPAAFFEVVGHTDDRPLGSSNTYRDNKDLSYGRADAVGRYVAGAGGISLDNFEFTGVGSGRPVATNTTPEGRGANRRVEIFIRGLLTDDQVDDLKSRAEELTTL